MQAANPCLATPGPARIAARTEVRAIALSAGVALNKPRPAGGISAYLEDDNNNRDSTFEKKRSTANYNDQTRIIATAAP